MSRWTPERIAVLQDLYRPTHLHTTRLTFEEIGERMGCSRGMIAGAVRRYIHFKTDVYVPSPSEIARRDAYRAALPLRGDLGLPSRWTESALTETYAERKLRRKQESIA